LKLRGFLLLRNYTRALAAMAGVEDLTAPEISD
jgi:hypothetical protein